MDTAPGSPPDLASHHLAELRASGLSDDTVAAAGLRTLRDEEAIRKALRWRQDGRRIDLGACLAFPFRGADGAVLEDYVRLKPTYPRKDRTSKKAVKYESPIGMPNRAYFPPEVIPSLRDPAVSLFITEGEKKSLKATQEGFPCIGLVGVFGWMQKREKDSDGQGIGQRELIPDLLAVEWKDRTVYLVFDSDAADNRGVRSAEWQLAKTLQRHGAKVRVVRLSSGPPDASEKPLKVGLDDFLVASSAEAFRELIARSLPPTKPPQPKNGEIVGETRATFSNCDLSAEENGEEGFSLPTLRTDLLRVAQGWPKAAGGMLFYRGASGSPAFLEKQSQLFGWMGEQLAKKPKGGYARHSNILWADRKQGCHSKEEFFQHLRGNVEQFDAVESSPHFPPFPSICYMHPKAAGGDGHHLAQFLSFFKPLTPVDGKLMLAFVLSLFWGGPPGKRPAWLICGPEEDERGGRGVGKTTFVEKSARLAGGMLSINDPAGSKSEDLERRLLSPGGRLLRVLCIDNLKALKFSWGFLEACITAEWLSGRQMYVGEGRRPNLITWCITANGASLSRDMAQRCIVLRLDRPVYVAGDWDQAIDDFIAKHRWDIIGDIQAIFERKPAPLAESSRWGLWAGEVLGRVLDPEEVLAVISTRSDDFDEDADEQALVREAICAAIRAEGLDPDVSRVKFKVKVLAKILESATDEKRATNKASAYLGQLQIPELKGRSRRKGNWRYWHGKNADADARPVAIAELRCDWESHARDSDAFGPGDDRAADAEGA